ncbi:MAG: thiamine pyrophosphate-dependent enzyme [Spirochaetota bacterium]
MTEMVLLGDEALAMGAIHAGISAAYAYPGTPSTEITEFLIEYSKREGSPKASWCVNEKTAFEEALGVSLVGKRSLVSMKHVGLNVAADPFINAALLEINGGLVLAVADDPGMHSSQNEQDSRFYADFAKILCLEPRNQQETYEMAVEAFELSEQFHIPIMIRLSTRLAHSRAVVTVGDKKPENELCKAQDTSAWMLLPAFARTRWEVLLDKQADLARYCEASPHNRLEINPGFAEFGVITAGIGRNYYEENVSELAAKPSHLHIATYPIPVNKVRELAQRVKKIVVIEEGYPFIEKALNGILPPAVKVAGKESGDIPLTGELNPDSVRPILALEPKQGLNAVEFTLPPRPPQLCAGCPHADSYDALKIALSGYPQSLVTSDIGCYALGALPPYSAIETIVCMGASIGLAKGASEAGFSPVVAVIGDSTFLHSGLTPTLDAVAANTPVTILILDNGTVAMTGGQETIIPSSRIEPLIIGLGVEKEHIRIINPLKKYTEENAAIIKQEIEYEGVSVILSTRECIETLKIKKKHRG